MDFVVKKRTPINIIGVRLDVDKPQEAVKKIGAFWQNFSANAIKAKIPNQIPPGFTMAVYTNYEAEGYSLILGTAVTNTITVPPSMVALTIPEQTYAVFTVQGKRSTIIADTWKQIWKKPLARAFTYDFEVYKNESEQNADVELYIALRPDYSQA